jgi:hypothetical protein
MRAGGGALVSLATNAPVMPVAAGLTLPYFGFAAGIGSNRGVGVLFSDPVLIVQDDVTTRRLTIPRADLYAEGWRPAVEPAAPPTTDVSGPPSGDVTYGRMPDHATALCRAKNGVYVAMVAFPTVPYLVHYDADADRFRTYALPASTNRAVTVVFERPDRLYYVLAGSTELRSAELATA